MMEHGKTIRQIAEELGVSKQAVHQKRKSKALETALQPFTTTIDGTVYISPEGETLLKQAFIKPETPTPSTVNDNGFTPVDGHVDGSEHPLYAILKAELEAKNKQIEQLQADLAEERQHSREQAKELAKLAEQAQALHAGTIQTQLPPAEEQPIEVDAEPAPAEPKKKAGFFSRWFGLGE